MSLSLHQQSPIAWQLKGHFDVASITKMIKPGYRMINQAPDNATVAVDLSGVEHADSASVALLLDWWRYAKTKNKSVTFTNLPQKMQDIINVSNLENILPIS